MPVMLDESLCGYPDAVRAIERGTADMLNVRLSKCGGIIPALRIIGLARRSGVGVQLGCHPGETALLSAAENSTAALIVGNRMANPDGMPWMRRLVNRWMSRRLSRLTNRLLPDTQCGFRLFQLDAWSALALHTTHFEVESEMLVAFIAAGHTIKFVPVQTIYKREQSKISPLRDSLRWLRWWRKARPISPGVKSPP